MPIGALSELHLGSALENVSMRHVFMGLPQGGGQPAGSTQSAEGLFVPPILPLVSPVGCAWWFGCPPLVAVPWWSVTCDGWVLGVELRGHSPLLHQYLMWAMIIDHDGSPAGST